VTLWSSSSVVAVGRGLRGTCRRDVHHRRLAFSITTVCPKASPESLRTERRDTRQQLVVPRGSRNGRSRSWLRVETFSCGAQDRWREQQRGGSASTVASRVVARIMFCLPPNVWRQAGPNADAQGNCGDCPNPVVHWRNWRCNPHNSSGGDDFAIWGAWRQICWFWWRRRHSLQAI